MPTHCSSIIISLYFTNDNCEKMIGFPIRVFSFVIWLHDWQLFSACQVNPESHSLCNTTASFGFKPTLDVRVRDNSVTLPFLPPICLLNSLLSLSSVYCFFGISSLFWFSSHVFILFNVRRVVWQGICFFHFSVEHGRSWLPLYSLAWSLYCTFHSPYISLFDDHAVVNSVLCICLPSWFESST